MVWNSNFEVMTGTSTTMQERRYQAGAAARAKKNAATLVYAPKRHRSPRKIGQGLTRKGAHNFSLVQTKSFALAAEDF
jgi:hypothetical protein